MKRQLFGAHCFLLLHLFDATLAVISTGLLYFNAAHTPWGHNQTSRWFARTWERLYASTLLALPRNILSVLLDGTRGIFVLGAWFRRGDGKNPRHIATFLDVGMLLASSIAAPLIVQYWYGPRWGFLVAVLALPYAVAILVDHLPLQATYHSMHGFLVSQAGSLCNGANLVSTGAGVCVAFVHATDLPLRLAFPAMCLIVPFAWSVLCRVLDSIMLSLGMDIMRNAVRGEGTSRVEYDRSEFYHQDIISGVILWGFIATPAALLFGRLIEPGAMAPFNVQLLAANVVTDAITFLVTFWLMRLLTEPDSRFSIIEVIVLDLILAAGMACLSIWAGLWGGPQAMDWREVGYLLVGHSPARPGWEIGPLFWVMHSSFLPTLIYSSAVLFVWFLRAITYWPCKFLFAHVRGIKPLEATGTALGAIAALLVLIELCADIHW